MPHQLLAETAATISELKANPMQVMSSGHGMPIVILDHNQPAFYCIPAPAYEAIIELIDDMELLNLARERLHEESIEVQLDHI